MLPSVPMIHLLILAVHLLATIAKLVRPSGMRAVVAESLVLKHQLLISSRARRRAPNLNSFDRLLLGLGSLFVPASRFPKLAVILKPRTLLQFHEAFKKRKYRWLFSSGGHRRPGPKGPSKELIDAIVEFKRRNPRVGCPRIAQEIAHAFGIDIDKDIVRRVLAKHYRPEAGTDGPSWLSFIGHMKDSLWCVDLFRCESILLRSHWVMVVMDVFTRRIIGFGVERADPCGASICRMFNQIIAPTGRLGLPEIAVAVPFAAVPGTSLRISLARPSECGSTPSIGPALRAFGLAGRSTLESLSGNRRAKRCWNYSGKHSCKDRDGRDGSKLRRTHCEHFESALLPIAIAKAHIA